MNILIADDREENRTILQAKLSAHGYTSEAARNGAEGLARLRRGRFDAVITDLLMPIMDGYQFTHAIKTSEHLRHLPVIIYTSTYTDPRDEALARNLGANAFILKPAGDEQFFALLASTIQRATQGGSPAAGPLPPDELQYLRSYTARLVQKLEDKAEEAAEANRKLLALNSALEAKVAAATADLREMNAELEAFVNSATHDLRAPLRTIEGLGTLLLEDDAELAPEERQRLVQRIVVNASRMQKLMNDLLDYSQLKQNEVPLLPVESAECVRQALERLGHEIAARQAHVEVREPLPRVMAFEPVLTQALVNILSNAIKFVPAEVAPRVTIAAEDHGDRIRLNVTDNGIGIAEAHQHRIFNVFERLNNAAVFPGSGVGLAMAKRAVQKMGGGLGFTSQVGAGSTFWIELPAAVSSPA